MTRQTTTLLKADTAKKNEKKGGRENTEPEDTTEEQAHGAGNI